MLCNCRGGAMFRSDIKCSDFGKIDENPEKPNSSFFDYKSAL